MIGVGYGSQLEHADCEVLLYGDSTGEVGLSPEIIRQLTGLKTCNIAQEQGLIVLSGDFVLADYMRQNAPPRFLIFLYSAGDMNPQAGRGSHPIFEALTYQMGRNHRLATLASLWRTPEDAFRWAYKGMHMVLLHVATPPVPVEALTVRERTMGRLPLEDVRMNGNCSDVSKSSPPDRAFLQGLRSKYGSAQTTVLVDLMPVPDCDPGFPVLQRQFSGIIDNQVAQLPSRYYFREGLHVDDEGSAVLSASVAEQILQRMHSQASMESR